MFKHTVMNKDTHPYEPSSPPCIRVRLPTAVAVARKTTLRLVAWETTRNCNLSCVHCRAAATNGPYAGELDTGQAFTLLDQIAEVGRPIIILTGGEPLLREDIFDIAKYGDDLGLRMVMAPNGTLITPQVAQKNGGIGHPADQCQHRRRHQGISRQNFGGWTAPSTLPSGVSNM